jgi:hypothetical protein
MTHDDDYRRRIKRVSPVDSQTGLLAGYGPVVNLA